MLYLVSIDNIRQCIVMKIIETLYSLLQEIVDEFKNINCSQKVSQSFRLMSQYCIQYTHNILKLYTTLILTIVKSPMFATTAEKSFSLKIAHNLF